jgi:pyruvate dehydrogenase E1 component
VPRRYTVLGTDGFGRSDTRAALRSFFEVDRHHVVLAALRALADDGTLDRKVVKQAIEKYGIDPDRPNAWDC